MWSLCWLDRALDGATNSEVLFRALSLSFAFAYASLHCLGLGLATMAGYIGVIGVLLVAARAGSLSTGYQQRLVFLGGGASVLAAAHGCMMILTLPPGDLRARFAGGLLELGTQSLGYLSCVLFACVRSLWSPNAWPRPNVNFIGHEWPYGAGIVLFSLLYSRHLWRRWRISERDPRDLGQLCWHVFSIASFGLCVVMTAVRVWKGEPWLGYLIGSRYLWPFAVLLSGTLASLVLHLRFRDRFTAPAFGLLLAGVCLTGNLIYQREVAPKVWPNSQLSHEMIWREIVAMTEELRTAQLSLPDLLISDVGEFALPLHVYEPLLRRSRALDPKFPVNWIGPSQIAPPLWSEMKERSPALRRLTGTIFAGADRSLSAVNNP